MSDLPTEIEIHIETVDNGATMVTSPEAPEVFLYGRDRGAVLSDLIPLTRRLFELNYGGPLMADFYAEGADAPSDPAGGVDDGTGYLLRFDRIGQSPQFNAGFMGKRGGS